jgi:hypothetical protein
MGSKINFQCQLLYQPAIFFYHPFHNILTHPLPLHILLMNQVQAADTQSRKRKPMTEGDRS